MAARAVVMWAVVEMEPMEMLHNGIVSRTAARISAAKYQPATGLDHNLSTSVNVELRHVLV